MPMNHTARSETAARAFSIIDVEADIAEQMARHRPLAAPTPADFAPPAVRGEPLPDYVQHAANVSDVGALSAEAVVKQYETAAKAVEAMGAELTSNLAKLDATKVETMAAINELIEVAAQYRETGKRIFLEIENHAMMTAEVRNACKAFKDKIAGTSA
jgi:hypothetical protein